MELENALLSCPFESLNRKLYFHNSLEFASRLTSFAVLKLSRNSYKIVEQELAGISKKAHVLLKDPKNDSSKGLAITQLAQKLRATKRKLEEGQERQLKSSRRCVSRASYVQSAPENDLVPRVIADYLLQRGYHFSARAMVQGTKIEELLEFDLFAQYRRVLNALNQHDVSKLLAWCSANRSRLRRFNSSLEFEIRVQQVIEEAKHNRTMDAIRLCQKYFPSEFSSHAAEISRVMTAIVLYNGAGTISQQLSDYYSPFQWSKLIDLFGRDFLRINGLPQRPLLDIYLQAGLSALKTPLCGSPHRSMSDCPVCCQDVVELAAKLTPLRRRNSSLVCQISGKVMDEHNLPYVLPNGHVYSYEALAAQAAANGGQVICLRTGGSFKLRDCRPAYLL